MNSVHLTYKDQPVNAVQVGKRKHYCKDHTKKHKHAITANVAEGTYSCNWNSQIQLFLPYHHDMFTNMNKF
jgi:hypothetical protein